MTSHQHAMHRTLGLWEIVLFGIAYMAPMIVYGTFGVLADASSGAVPSSYVIALAAILLTAFSYGRMAFLFPTSGSAYTYTAKSFNRHVGFMVGWAILLDYFFLPMVIWVIGVAYMSTALPDVPIWVWVLAFILITTVINVIGVAFAHKVNTALMLAQMLIVAAFVALCARYVYVLSGPSGLVSIEPFFKPGLPFGSVMAGAAIAAYSFLGFDAVSTLTEETVEPKRVMPKAIMLVALLGGVIFVIAAYFTQLAHPGATFDNVDSASFEIAKAIGGDIFVTIFVVGLIVAQFASGIAAQASVGRLLFAMGRDGVLPKSIFGKLNSRFKTPAFNIVLSGVVGLAALKLDVATSTSFINFGAFIAFICVNLSVIAQFFSGNPEARRGGALLSVVVPGLGAAFDAWLLYSLDNTAITLGLIWLAVGIVYLAYLTGFFRRQPPEMEFQDEYEVVIGAE
ncbi:MAG TPA: amino acid permease [Candidatus Sulfotelmatobacter sp.]|nr:amino acid permease [Candidatus Sulfotelmatobacter sp.]